MGRDPCTHAGTLAYGVPSPSHPPPSPCTFCLNTLLRSLLSGLGFARCSSVGLSLGRGPYYIWNSNMAVPVSLNPEAIVLLCVSVRLLVFWKSVVNLPAAPSRASCASFPDAVRILLFLLCHKVSPLSVSGRVSRDRRCTRRVDELSESRARPPAFRDTLGPRPMDSCCFPVFSIAFSFNFKIQVGHLLRFVSTLPMSLNLSFKVFIFIDLYLSTHLSYLLYLLICQSCSYPNSLLGFASCTI